jgi:signal transduction histidine kinase
LKVSFRMYSGKNPDKGDSISFGPYRLFPGKRLIERSGVPLPIGSRSLDILIVLVERAGEVVSKSELISRVWANLTVAESCLRVQMTSLRRVLEDGHNGVRYIANVPGRGYCFVGRIEFDRARGVLASEGIDLTSHTYDDEADEVRLRVLGLTSAAISHDLRNMMQVLLSAIDMIEAKMNQRVDANDLRRFVNVARNSANKASDLTCRILNFAKPCHSWEEIVNIESMVLLLEDTLGWIVGPSVQVIVRVQNDVPPIACDLRELENVILNLVINSRDAMPSGGRLTLQLSREDEHVGGQVMPYVVIRVEDTGCGMSEDIAARAFEPFFTTKKKGSGLGLALANGFARRLKGVADIKSGIGLGTVVTLRIPAARFRESRETAER